jgi:S-adenosylmethionine:tRNA ribosyltransferase-isomerase
MKVSDFSFEIPEHLVAQAPPADRESSLLMTVDREPGRIDTGAFTDFPTMIEPGTQMVLNDSRVVKCRLRGVSATTGGKADFLLLSEEEPALWRALCRRLKAGRRYLFSDKLEGRVVGQRGTATLIRFNRRIDDTYLRKFGRVPLPPYIKREATSLDEERYQTVYAREPGSIAAPTAGLHFTQRVLGEIAGRGVGIVFITLHVGEGTFLPLRTNRVESHRMAEEGYHLSEEAAARLQTAREKGNKILAVGTTVVRALESSCANGVIRAGRRKTGLFIYPGYRFQVVDQLFTNFHTPRSSLFLLASAFAGRELIREAYATAIRKGFRMFSYGDAMFIR